MAKVIDITEKLTFGENPRLCIKGQELEINADAATVLKIMGIIGDSEQPAVSDILKSMNLLLDKKDRERLDSMRLNWTDYMTVINTAMELAAGTPEDDSEGEEETHTTT